MVIRKYGLQPGGLPQWRTDMSPFAPLQDQPGGGGGGSLGETVNHSPQRSGGPRSRELQRGGSVTEKEGRTASAPSSNISLFLPKPGPATPASSALAHRHALTRQHTRATVKVGRSVAQKRPLGLAVTDEGTG